MPILMPLVDTCRKVGAPWPTRVGAPGSPATWPSTGCEGGGHGRQVGRVGRVQADRDRGVAAHRGVADRLVVGGVVQGRE